MAMVRRRGAPVTIGTAVSIAGAPGGNIDGAVRTGGAVHREPP